MYTKSDEEKAVKLEEKSGKEGKQKGNKKRDKARRTRK